MLPLYSHPHSSGLQSPVRLQMHSAYPSQAATLEVVRGKLQAELMARYVELNQDDWALASKTKALG